MMGDVIRRHGDRMRHLISAALPGNESRLGQMTPLGMLQEMTAGLMRSQGALGYESQYWRRAVAQPVEDPYMWTPLHSSDAAESDPPSLATPATHRKWGIKHVSAPDDGDSPTKRLRFDEPTEKQLGTHGSDEGSFVPLADNTTGLEL
ncbi:hypothetical protein LTR49_026276 [Elasticomyces elasticus]|nr:hypothetical protein LTR49_026276 [Elasticomyces elasticus]